MLHLFFAGIAQLVERNLAKVEVASSNLVSRSNSWENEKNHQYLVSSFRFLMIYKAAGWQSGHAAACKAVDAGSIPTPASKTI